MSSNPKVSIVIPVYNGSNFLKEAIDSALTQTYDNIEVLVINDGSDDNGATRTIANSYDDRIRYFEKKNGGVSSALNIGIKNMNGDYFSWLSHDDVYYPEKIKHQIEYLSELDDEICVLYTGFEYIDDFSDLIRKPSFSKIPPEKFRLKLISSYPINGCTTLIHKDCIKTVGLFNEELKVIQDYDMWFRISDKYKFYHITNILVKSRIHKDQGTRLLSKDNIKELENSYLKLLSMFNFSDIKCEELIELFKGLSKKSNKLAIKAIYIILKNKSDCILSKLKILYLSFLLILKRFIYLFLKIYKLMLSIIKAK